MRFRKSEDSGRKGQRTGWGLETENGKGRTQVMKGNGHKGERI